MSPTRRDILKAAGAASLALALPTSITAEPEIDDWDMPATDVTIDGVVVTGSMGRKRFSIIQFDGPVSVKTYYEHANGKTYMWTHDYQTPALGEQVDALAQSMLHVFCNRAGWLGEDAS